MQLNPTFALLEHLGASWQIDLGADESIVRAAWEIA
jgi:hypothetical protein